MLRRPQMFAIHLIYTHVEFNHTPPPHLHSPVQDDLEKPILTASAAYFQRLAGEYLRDADCPTYLAKAEK